MTAGVRGWSQRTVVVLSVVLVSVVLVAVVAGVLLSQRDTYAARGEVAVPGREGGTGACFAESRGTDVTEETDVVATAEGEEVGTGDLTFERFEQRDAVRGRCVYTFEVDVPEGPAPVTLSVAGHAETFARVDLYDPVALELP